MEDSVNYSLIQIVAKNVFLLSPESAPLREGEAGVSKY